MKVLYCRVSTLDQKTDRQKAEESQYDYVVEDICSGAIPFFERPGGMEIKKLLEKKALTSLSAISIDRLGRNLRDIINSIHVFNEEQVPIYFLSQGLCTLDDKRAENPISKMIISILGTVAEMERNQIKERQREGIKIAKLKGAYKGRTSGSKEDVLRFLSKPKNKKALDLLRKGYKGNEVAAITGIHINTVTKVKKLGLST